MNEQPNTPHTGGDTSASPDPGPLAQSAAERLGVIIDAVERAAAGVIDDAEAQAKQHLERARERADRVAEERIRAITELTDGLIEQAEALKRQADSLIAAFGEANAEVVSLGEEGTRASRWRRRRIGPSPRSRREPKSRRRRPRRRSDRARNSPT